MRLTVSLEKGVVVVVPKSMSQRRMVKMIPAFVKDKQLWLSDAIEKLQARKQSTPDIEDCLLPVKVVLPAIEQDFYIIYQPLHRFKTQGSLPESENSLLRAEGSTILRHTNTYELEISGDLDNKRRVFLLLENFFKDYAGEFLKKRLDQLSQEFNLPYNRLVIRAQKTRWGSCSLKKNINLNYRLLFMDKELLDYILLHELVHTIHMNHSKEFWFYFESLMQDARRRDKQINQINKQLPCWIFFK